MSEEIKEGLAASFGLVFHLPEGLLNRRNTKQVRVSARKLAWKHTLMSLSQAIYTWNSRRSQRNYPFFAL